MKVDKNLDLSMFKPGDKILVVTVKLPQPEIKVVIINAIDVLGLKCLDLNNHYVSISFYNAQQNPTYIFNANEIEELKVVESSFPTASIGNFRLTLEDVV